MGAQREERNDDDEMQVVRVDELRERLHSQSDEKARTPGGRDALRVVRVDVVWQRVHAQSHEETPPRTGEPMHLVRVDVHGQRMHAQPDGKAREIGGAMADGRISPKTPALDARGNQTE